MPLAHVRKVVFPSFSCLDRPPNNVLTRRKPQCPPEMILPPLSYGVFVKMFSESKAACRVTLHLGLHPRGSQKINRTMTPDQEGARRRTLFHLNSLE